MTNEQMTLEQVLHSFDERRDPFYEHDVEMALMRFQGELKKKGQQPNDELVAELMAFRFCEDYKNDETGWGTYYGPMSIIPNKQGQMMESPSIQRVSEGMLDYWSRRANKAKNPILRCRYADLVWDFSRQVTGENASADMPRIMIDTAIEIAVNRLHTYEMQTITKLERALSLALSLNDTNRVEKVRDAIISYADLVAEDNKPGLWAFVFELLIDNDKVPLSDAQRNKIIGDLEVRLERVSDTRKSDKFDPFASEAAALRLARYYRKLNQGEDSRRVLVKYGNAFLKASESASAMVGSTWLQKVHSEYLDFGLKAEADAIAVRLRETGEKCNQEMIPISHEMELSREEMESYVEAMTEGDLDTVLARIACHYVTDREVVEKQVKDLSKNAIITFLFTTTIQDHKGRPVAHIGSLENDLDGHIIHQTSQNMWISAIFLRAAIERLQAKFKPSANEILDYLYRSPVFEPEKRPIIEAGLKAFFENNHIVSVHLLVPQIEDTLRNLLEKIGGAVYKRGRSSGLFLKSLDEVLREQSINQVLGENTSLYLRILLTDQRGWNLRNTVCHGISPANYFTPPIADRVFHALILLGQLRQTNSDKIN